MNRYKQNMQRENPLALLNSVLRVVLERVRILYHTVRFLSSRVRRGEFDGVRLGGEKQGLDYGWQMAIAWLRRRTAGSGEQRTAWSANNDTTANRGPAAWPCTSREIEGERRARKDSETRNAVVGVVLIGKLGRRETQLALRYLKAINGETSVVEC
jgi:hypothetical protein